MLKIFVEGKESVFLKDLIEYRLNKVETVDFEIISTGGWTKLESVKPKIQEFTDQGFNILVIFDADYPEEGGFQNRLDWINEFRTKNDFKFNIYLFPNNQNNGVFEDLLELSINKTHQAILDCFTAYENCLSGYNEPDEKYQLPIKKSKIYAYVDAFPKSRKQKERFKNKGDFFFKNIEIWDLNSQELEPLVQLIETNI